MASYKKRANRGRASQHAKWGETALKRGVLSQKVKTAKGRKISSTRWLQRQLNDSYVIEAKARGYRSRAAFKLLEIHERYALLKRGMHVLDLGAAPGGWSQVAASFVQDSASEKEKKNVIALDLLEIEPLEGVEFLQGDFLEEGMVLRLKELLDGKIDLILSDMAPKTTGHAQVDHLRIMHLCEHVFSFATEILSPGGSVLAKVFQGGAEQAFLQKIKVCFSSVRHIKPPASRKESSEMYVLAQNFCGGKIIVPD